MSKSHLFYLVDINTKFNEAQKRLQGEDVGTIIQARMFLMGFQTKLGIRFKSALECKDFKYFS